MKLSFATLLATAALLATSAIAIPPPRAGSQNAPLSPTEVQSLSARVVANQHRNDQFLEQYEHIEHLWIRKPGPNPPPAQETISRVLPTGTGIMRLPLAATGKPANPAAYHDQLEYLAHVLESVAHPDVTEQQTLDRYHKRQQDRADMVSNAGNAFRFSWLGRETRDGRVLIKLQMEPNPNFHPATIAAQVLQHVRAVVWIDESAAQVVHLEAQIVSDVWIGAGILAKIYRGGTFVMDQTEVAPGVWEPVRYKYDIDGRKFLFSYSDHETEEFSQYRFVGPPAAELQLVRNELNTASADPPRH